MDQILLYALGVIFVILGIGASIAIHELGHLWPAKRFGVRVKQYMVGFGPTVFSRRRGETEYGIKAIPLGGYISMVGMFDPSAKPTKGPFAKLINDARETAAEELEPADQGREFFQLAPWKKLTIMLGGPFMNLVLGVVLVVVALSGLGVNQSVPKVSQVSECWVPTGEACTPSDVKTPAFEAGLQAGDQIAAIDDEVISTWAEANEVLLQSTPGNSIQLTVLRGDQQLLIPISPLWMETESGLAPRLGIYLDTDLVRMSVPDSLGVSGESLGAVFGLIVSLPVAVWEVGQTLLSGDQRDPNGPISILGVGQLAGEVAAADQLSVIARLSTGLMILGSLNFALFAFNLIPLLPLDGGHVVGAAYEAVKRGVFKALKKPSPPPVDSVRLVPLAYLVWVVLVAVGLLLIVADLLKPITL